MKYYKNVQKKIRKEAKQFFEDNCQLTVTTTVDPLAGWECFENSCYKKSSDPSNYRNAHQYCVEQDAYLVTITSPEENRFVQQVCGEASCWIGLQEVQKDYWTWTSHEERNGNFRNWYESEPNDWNGQEETVAFMNLVNPDFDINVNGQWYDGIPEDDYQFPLCEKSLGTTQTPTTTTFTPTTTTFTPTTTTTTTTFTPTTTTSVPAECIFECARKCNIDIDVDNYLVIQVKDQKTCNCLIENCDRPQVLDKCTEDFKNGARDFFDNNCDLTSSTTSEPTTTKKTCIDVTFDIRPKIWADEMIWQVKGTDCSGSEYVDNRDTKENCCLDVGEYTIVAEDLYGDGWHGGFIETGSIQHFKGFVGGNQKRAESKFKITETGFYEPPKTDECVEVEFSIKTAAWSSQISWLVENTDCVSEDPYPSHTVINQKCCLPPGEHSLLCIDSFEDGWTGGYLKVNGKTFCKNFKNPVHQSTFTVDPMNI